MMAMLRKRLLYFRRDIKAWAFQLVMPIFFVLIGLIVQKFVNTIDILNINKYNQGYSSNVLPLPYSNRSVFSECDKCTPDSVQRQQSFLASARGAANLPLLAVNYEYGRAANSTVSPLAPQTVSDMGHFLLDNEDRYQASTFGAFIFTDIGLGSTGAVTALSYLLDTNFTAVHAGPVFSNFLADSLVRSYNPSYSITEGTN